MKILAVGESMIELSDAGDHLISWTYAGDALNWAVAIAHALPDAEVRHLCAVGDDERSMLFTSFCADLGVDTSHSPVLPGRNMGMYWISTVDGDRRFRYWRAESAAREHLRLLTELPFTDRSDVVMFSNITLAVAGPNAATLLARIALLREQGTTVIYDTNFRPRLWESIDDARSMEALALEAADYVHASLDDVRGVWQSTGPEFATKLAHLGVAEAIITDGAGEALIAQAGTTTSVQPRTVEPADTSGAGDAFFGTYVGHRLSGSSIEDAVESAAEVCARVVRHAGALTYRRAGDSGSPETPG